MKKKLSPSMMCADIFELDECIRTFERCGVDMLHIDVMDGRFVPNYTLGTDYIKALKEKTKIPLDIHLMIDEPENKLGWFTIPILYELLLLQKCFCGNKVDIITEKSG